MPKITSSEKFKLKRSNGKMLDVIVNHSDMKEGYSFGMIIRTAENVGIEGWSAHYEGILVMPINDNEIVIYLTDYWHGVLPTEIPLLVTTPIK